MKVDDLPAGSLEIKEQTALLREAVELLRSIDRRLADRNPEIISTFPDPAVGDLLRAIFEYGAGIAFSASMLVEKAETDDQLRSAILTCCGSLSTAKLGQALARCRGRDVDGLVLERCKRLWSVQRKSPTE